MEENQDGVHCAVVQLTRSLASIAVKIVLMFKVMYDSVVVVMLCVLN